MKPTITSTAWHKHRSLFPILLVPFFLLTSCSKKSEQRLSPQSPEAENQIKLVYGNYLTFPDEASFKNAIANSRTLTEGDQQQFDANHSFISMASSFRKFDKEISRFESMKDTTGFHLVKEKYGKSLYWKAVDEYYVNSPDWETSKIINQNGLVKIGEEIIKFDRDRKITLKHTDLQSFRNALSIRATTSTPEYVVDYYPKSKASTESTPGYKWLSLNGFNPQEGAVTNGITDQYQLQSSGRRFTYSVWLVNIRKGGVLYAFTELHYSGMRKQFLFWQRAKVTDVVINGSIVIKLGSDGFSPTFTCRYTNYGVADRWYETYYNDDIEGHEILAISEKLVNHPDPYSILGPPGIPPQLPYYVDMRKHPAAPSYFFNDINEYNGSNLQSSPGYHWNHVTAGNGPFTNPNQLTIVTANVEGETFDINF
ncbi:hypothetical protein HGH93_29055 [Chitinophaga polysaccharea]|uniref:hypothetical protein n=1 Tax=Chitinophaga TaxID=79328 RepID=UPI00145598BD|nr:MULTISPECIES: hypothetical protein [Chitinophaga]NLR62176.1 hypothetical protein [Chitinophaga polysaccharea]NLU95630.1 hypothetical protein [Chitinophaga sp. Ak27]